VEVAEGQRDDVDRLGARLAGARRGGLFGDRVQRGEQVALVGDPVAVHHPYRLHRRARDLADVPAMNVPWP